MFALLPLDCSIVFVTLFVVLLVVGFCASACFFASRARRLRSASLLPEATRPGFLTVAGLVCFGTSEVTRSGVAAGATVSSGTVLSVCVIIVYTVYNVFKKTCKVSVRFLLDFYKIAVNFVNTFQWITVAISGWVCGCWPVRWCGWCLKLDVFCCYEGSIG